MSSGFTIHVSGLAPETSETKLHDFFSVRSHAFPGSPSTPPNPSSAASSRASRSTAPRPTSPLRSRAPCAPPSCSTAAP
jgi:hypothetical protein